MFFTAFSTIVQLIYLEMGALVTQHAATVAARAAIVVAADDPKFYGSGTGSLGGKRKTDVDEAVTSALRVTTPKGTDPVSRVTFSGGFGEGQIVKARVEHDFRCDVPIGRIIVCGLSRKTMIAREASMPSQTAGYTYP